MSALIDQLRKKYRTPKEAMAALGLDESFLESGHKSKENVSMSKKVLTRFGAAAAGALAIYLKPKLAADAQIDLSEILHGITAATYKAAKPKIAQDIKAKAKLAKDANLDDVVGLLDKLEDCRVEEGADSDPNSGLPMSAEDLAKKAKDEAEKEDAEKKAKDKAARDAFRAGLDSKSQEAYDALFGKEDGEEKDDKDKEKAKDADPDEDKEKKKEAVDKKAMDSAIQAAVQNERKNARAVAEAYEAVEPYVGKLKLGMDSAAEVYRTALKGLGMDAKDVDALHPDALKPVLQAQKKPGEGRSFAQDAVPAGDAGGFASRWGDQTSRIRAA